MNDNIQESNNTEDTSSTEIDHNNEKSVISKIDKLGRSYATEEERFYS